IVNTEKIITPKYKNKKTRLSERADKCNLLKAFIDILLPTLLIPLHFNDMMRQRHLYHLYFVGENQLFVVLKDLSV
ncbi:hypothetical protein DVA81_18440, partial [Acinetobacter baumannii]